MPKHFATETELGAVVRQYLLDRGFLVFEEVPVKDVNASADIVGVSKDEVWVVECKLHLGLDVMAQGDRWVGHCHRTWVAVPAKYTPTLTFAKVLLEHRGIGLLFGHDHGRSGRVVSQELAAKVYTEPVDIGLVGALHQEHASGNWAPAGAQKGSRFTPYVNTCRQLLVLVTEEPGLTIKEAVGKIHHHYHTDQNAISSLLMWAKKGTILGVKAEFDGRRYRLYPSTSESSVAA